MRVGEVEVRGTEDLDRWAAETGWLLLGTPVRMTALGRRLVTATKGGPGEPEAEPLRRFGEGQEQAPDLRDRERDQSGGISPFSLSPSC
jgi:hypothetical protein